jgi:glutathione S-transferase
VFRLYEIPHSTNVERVLLALGHKQLRCERVMVDPTDRSVVRAISGQDLVPVLDHDGQIIFDSTRILEYLERVHPERPLYPPDPARRAEMELFIDWFNRVWKRPPNLLHDELLKPNPDRLACAGWASEIEGFLPRFEALLSDRPFLFGASFSAADCCAYPFLKYGLGVPAGDRELFHRILADHQPLGQFSRLVAWLHRVDAQPRA